ncbi:MAG TPA: alpha/beta hydrolase [Candidatus Dormibacteraeota bacterium]|nr:alpha/beta hydrolase [Candidatus Dormibacteraeota bacterium]
MEPRRATANGVDFAYLSAGPEDGPLALCLHGFPDHAPSFTPMLDALASAGFHAVAPWMRGYHPTAPAPDGRYQSAVLALDALALIEALSADGCAALVGHDWGALAACGAAILQPSRVRAMVAMALPHPAVLAATLIGDWEQRKRSWYMWFFLQDVLPGLVVPAGDHAFIDRLWRDWSPGFAPDPARMAALKQTLSAPGVLDAALGYYRQTLDFARQADDLIAAQTEVQGGSIAVPALFLMGADDGCFAPDRERASLAHCTGEARVEILDGVGHFLHVEDPDRVNGLVLDWLVQEGGARPHRARPGSQATRGSDGQEGSDSDV